MFHIINIFTGQSSSVLKYQTGNTYIYSLEGTTVTSLSGSNGDPLKVQLKASAELSVLESCGRILRVKNVQIIGTDSKVYLYISRERERKR